jgi:tetratricopeptide (TPR) repeat protein
MVEILGTDERREIGRLERALELGNGSEFHLVVGDTRRVVDAALAEVLPAVEVPHESVEPGETPKAFAVRWMMWLEAATHAGGAQPVVLDAWDVDPEHIEHWGWIFARLNERRNELMRGLGRPLLLLVSPDNERLLGHMAPDLWSIRGVGMRLRDRGKIAVDRSARGVALTPSTRPPAPEEIERQQQRVDRARSGAAPIGRAIESLRLARMLHASGPQRGEEALALAEEAIARYEVLVDDEGNKRIDLARALRLHAEIAAGIGRRQQAIDDLRRSIAILDEVAAEEPDRAEYQRDLTIGYAELADLHRALGEVEVASSWDERAAAIRVRLAELEPEREGLRRSMNAPSAFISYSHDSGEHADRVLALADRLRADGIDTRLDQYIIHPPEGWPAWTQRQIAQADFVLLVCSPTYRRRFEHDLLPGTGRGATWEATIADQLLYELGARKRGLVPILFDGSTEQDIPRPLRSFTYYRIPESYLDLYRRISFQPVAPPPLDQTHALSPRPHPASITHRSIDDLDSPIGEHAVASNGTLGSRSSPEPDPAESAPASRLPEKPDPSTPATILIFTANFPDQRLRLEEEVQAIENALARAHERHRYNVQIIPEVSFNRFINDLDDHSPTIIHYSGHGSSSGDLAFVSSSAKSPHYIRPMHLRTLFAFLHPPPQIVVFATNSSGNLAEAAAHYARYAIGFDGNLRDDTAQLFSSIFYERLASRIEPDVPRAFGLARLACLAAGHDDAENARLFEHPGREVTGT